MTVYSITSQRAATAADEVRKTFSTFVLSGITEVRSIDRIVGGRQLTYSGYFTDPEKLIASLKQLAASWG